MKEMVNIRYKTIISHGEEKVDDLYEGMAYRELMVGIETWSFKHPQYGQMSIEIRGNEVSLKHGLNDMKLKLNEKNEIAYQTGYGTMILSGLLKKLERKDNHLRIVYYLFDGSEIISQCYLVLDVINTYLS